MHNLANTMLAQGDPAAAQQLQERVLAARRKVSGERHPDTLAALSNLAAIAQAQTGVVASVDLHINDLARYTLTARARKTALSASARHLEIGR